MIATPQQADRAIRELLEFYQREYKLNQYDARRMLVSEAMAYDLGEKRGRRRVAQELRAEAGA